MEVEDDEIECKPALPLPPNSEDPNSEYHDIYLYFKQNEKYRSESDKNNTLLQPHGNTFDFMETDFKMRIPYCGDEFKISPEFRLHHVEQFRVEKDELFKKKSEVVQKSEFPSYNKFKNLTEEPVDVNFLLGFQHIQIIELIKFCVEKCRALVMYSDNYCEWIYRFLLIAQEPLDSTISSSLNSILKYFCRAKQAIFDKDDKRLEKYNLIISTIVDCYRQCDEDIMI
ncbi:hypothetical protein EIN_275150 [Entamoeba invadens IP1]|uniref:Gem-associated protein 2 n=1 Tax=Entamoeba invadens IP1 TaxID=370355 RepID=A0A0A1U4W9_ENTIV|nr:hypothetical protein EIN_275150 [Entamoeba invadens IP1]ELP87928.1 hypothetical protein EIN_275150 [Entamoeba invadens IP1]|eukprot:XP_004254699.1 hypothetical protein EIN_275150 [Entamoeba invadens IP1]